MNKQPELQKILEDILGSRNVYYQPPASIMLKYPAIVYTRRDIKNIYANDLPYQQHYSYTITLIDKNPNSEFLEKLSRLPSCNYDRHYTSDNLNHDVFTIYY